MISILSPGPRINSVTFTSLGTSSDTEGAVSPAVFDVVFVVAHPLNRTNQTITPIPTYGRYGSLTFIIYSPYLSSQFIIEQATAIRCHTVIDNLNSKCIMCM